MSMEMVLAEAVIDSGDTAWVLISAGLVLFMVPGLAFFYAGLVRGSSALVMLQQNLVPLGLVSITWVVFGYSFAFSGDWGSGFLGDLKLFGLQDIHTAAAPGFHLIEGAVAVPTLAFVVYQMMFAIITPALITGATANRLKPLGWAVLLVLWSIIVYPPDCALALQPRRLVGAPRSSGLGRRNCCARIRRCRRPGNLAGGR